MWIKMHCADVRTCWWWRAGAGLVGVPVWRGRSSTPRAGFQGHPSAAELLGAVGRLAGQRGHSNTEAVRGQTHPPQSCTPVPAQVVLLQARLLGCFTLGSIVWIEHMLGSTWSHQSYWSRTRISPTHITDWFTSRINLSGKFMSFFLQLKINQFEENIPGFFSIECTSPLQRGFTRSRIRNVPRNYIIHEVKLLQDEHLWLKKYINIIFFRKWPIVSLDKTLNPRLGSCNDIKISRYDNITRWSPWYDIYRKM